MDETSKGRGKGRGRGRGRGRGQRKQSTKASREPEPEPVQPAVQDEPVIEDKAVETQPAKVEDKENEIVIPTPQTIDMESDISQLEVTTFTTLSRGPPEPMTKLNWSHKVSLIGEKVLNPMIHCCDQCEKPILIYGRMIPCKHVFCLKCAREEPLKMCPRCKEKVIRVEQSGLGTVFMCSHGGTRYGNTGCRRTYLSQRDLQAHINHRHINNSVESKQQPEIKTSNVIQRKPAEQPASRQNTRQPTQFTSSISSVPSSTVSNSTVTRSNTMSSTGLQDNSLQSQQQQQPLMPLGNVHQQPQMANVPEMYYNTMSQQQQQQQQQQYGGYGNAGQQQNPPPMQANYGAMHQQPNPGMSMMMAQQAVHMSRPPPPQGPGYFSQYGQYGQMPQHYPNSRQYEQQNFNAPPNAQQWNQQQYYR